MFLTGAPFSSRRRIQKSLIPGPLITAPRIIFFPFFKVSRLDRQSSFTIRRSPDKMTTSSPFSHHMEAEFEPTDILTFGMSSGQLITVTAQNSTPYICFWKRNEKTISTYGAVFNYKTRDELLRIKIGQILYFEADRNYTKLLLSNGIQFTFAINIGKIRRDLREAGRWL